MSETTTVKKPKPFYKRRRFCVVIVLLLLVYFCLVPSRQRISVETTGITEPLNRKGQVDYFGAYERLYLDKLSPPEDNGLRLMIAACGPSILEQAALVKAVPWEQMPTHEQGKNYFENRWKPLCEHLYIDPYAQPPFLYSHGFYGYIHELKEQAKAKLPEGEILEDDDESGEKLWNTLVDAPWKHEDYPEIAKWLETYSPVLDYFGMCVRKPNYTCWRAREKEQGPFGEYETMYCILLPDVQATRDFARSLRVRVTERLGRGDVDGAWEDVMSMLHIGRHHFSQEPFFVTNLVGIAISEQAYEAAERILRYGNPSAEQLERFARDLDSFPRANFIAQTLQWERYGAFETLRLLASLNGYFYCRDLYGDENEQVVFSRGTRSLQMLSLLSIDLNIAGKRLNELYGMFDKDFIENERMMGDNPALRNRYAEKMQSRVDAIKEKHESNLQFARIPLIRTRSKLVAELLFKRSYSTISTVFTAFNRNDAKFDLLRMALAVERYQRETGEYPPHLDAVTTKYLESIPLDPFTARATMMYRLQPEEDCPYLIYSFGPNKADNGGLREEPGKNLNSELSRDDIVFRR